MTSNFFEFFDEFFDWEKGSQIPDPAGKAFQLKVLIRRIPGSDFRWSLIGNCET